MLSIKGELDNAPYLLEREFTLRTDHDSLTWLQNFRDPQGQLARWLERLQEFNFKVVHRQGRKHTNADALSRLLCRQCGRVSHHQQPSIGATSIRSPDTSVVDLRKAQLEDPVLAPLLQRKEIGRKPATEDLGPASRKSRRVVSLTIAWHWDYNYCISTASHSQLATE